MRLTGSGRDETTPDTTHLHLPSRLKLLGVSNPVNVFPNYMGMPHMEIYCNFYFVIYHAMFGPGCLWLLQIIIPDMFWFLGWGYGQSRKYTFRQKVPGGFVNAEFVCHTLFALHWSTLLWYQSSALFFFFTAMSIIWYSTKNVVFGRVYRDCECIFPTAVATFIHIAKNP